MNNAYLTSVHKEPLLLKEFTLIENQSNNSLWIPFIIPRGDEVIILNPGRDIYHVY